MNSSHEVEDQVEAGKWSYWVDPLLFTAYVTSLYYLGSKHRYNIEAVHILELNTLLDITIVVICKGLQNFDFYLQADLYCIIIHAIKHWAKFSFYSDFSLGEIDKFLSLYWSTSYKLRVTNHRVLVLIVAVKILLIPITVMAALLDTDYLRCSREYLWVCGHFKSTNFFWTTIPMVICSIVTIAVSNYTFRVARRLARTITPVNIPLPVIPSISGSTHSHDVKRMNSDPHSFKRVAVSPRIAPTLDHVISRTSELLQTAKTAVKVNIISLCTLGLLIPENILNTWVFFSGINCNNDPNFPFRAKFVLLFEVTCLIIYPYLIKRKLQNFL